MKAKLALVFGLITISVASYIQPAGATGQLNVTQVPISEASQTVSSPKISDNPILVASTYLPESSVGNYELIYKWVDNTYVNYYKNGNWKTGWSNQSDQEAKLNLIVNNSTQTQYLIGSGYPSASKNVTTDRELIGHALEVSFRKWVYANMVKAFQATGLSLTEATSQVEDIIKYQKNGVGYQSTRNKGFDVAAHDYKNKILADHTEFQLTQLNNQLKELEQVAQSDNKHNALFLMQEFLVAIEAETRQWDPNTQSVKQSLLPSSRHLFQAYSKTIRTPPKYLQAYNLEYMEENAIRKSLAKNYYTVVLPRLADGIATTMEALVNRSAVYTESSLGMMITAVDLFIGMNPSGTKNLQRVRTRIKGGSLVDDVRPRRTTPDLENPNPRGVPCVGFGINKGVLVASSLFGGNSFEGGVVDVRDGGWLEARNCVKSGWSQEFRNHQKVKGNRAELLPLEDARGQYRFEPPSLKNGGIDWDKFNISEGYLDSKGRIWKVDKASLSQGNSHWDVQTYNKKQGKWNHTNINPDGTFNHGTNNFYNF